jgi:uncharacterized phage protein gp47/JayE
MAEYPYTPPGFLQNQSADTIQKRMLDIIPAKYDKSENNFVWDFTRPPALEKAEFAEFELNEVIKLIFPQWAYGEWLDLHGDLAKTPRHDPNRASGDLTVQGLVGTIIPQGFKFATAADQAESVIFETLEQLILSGTPDAQGLVTGTAMAQAAKGGTAGNVAADTIKLMVSPMGGIKHVTNPAAMTGGTARESDERYRERVIAAMRQGASSVGNNADYIRWAKEVPAVGQVIVIPEADGPGTVKLILTDQNGMPANQQILNAVYSHIMGFGATDTERRAPIGAALEVAAPAGLEISIAATVLLGEGADLAVVTTRFTANLAGYWLEAAKEAQEAAGGAGYVRYAQVGAALAKTQGVADYEGLTINGQAANIAITQEQYPVTGEVNLSG